MAIEKELIGENGEKRKYFKIDKVVLDYENNNFSIECASYTDKSYRDKEKQAQEEYEKAKAEYYELNDKEEKTEEEIARLSEMNISEIENVRMSAKPLYLKKENFNIELSEEMRDLFYSLLKQNENFANAVDIFDNTNQKEENANV